MKKSIYILGLLFPALLFTGCEKEEIGSTAVVDLAGEWMVTVDAVDAEGNIVYTDDELYGLGPFLILTYNNNANASDRIIVDDLETFWHFKAEVSASVASKSFAGSDVIYQDEESGEDVTAVISDGQIVPDGMRSPVYDMPVDAIEFYVTFSDDPYPAMLGYDKYYVHGYRRTGFDGED